VEATSLGLKTKLGLGPNCRKYKGLYTNENVTVTVVMVTYSRVHHKLAVLSIAHHELATHRGSIMSWRQAGNLRIAYHELAVSDRLDNGAVEYCGLRSDGCSKYGTRADRLDITWTLTPYIP